METTWTAVLTPARSGDTTSRHGDDDDDDDNNNNKKTGIGLSPSDSDLFTYIQFIISLLNLLPEGYMRSM
jgi:hypothetical protein